MASIKRAPCVDMRTDVHKDERFACLADIAGLPGGRYEAIGRMHALYSWCVDRKLKDAPEDSDGYVVSAAVVNRFLGASGVMALLAERCDELALGREHSIGRYYLKGTSEYVLQLRRLVAAASLAGTARAAGANREGGKFVTAPTNTPASTSHGTSGSPATDQRPTSDPPAETSDLPLSSLLKEEEASPPAQPDLDLEPKKAKTPPTHTPAVAAFDRYYRATHEDRRPTWDKTTIAMVKTLVTKHTCAEVERRIGILSTGPPKFPPQPWDLKTFVGQFDNCAVITRADAQDQRGGIRTIPQL